MPVILINVKDSKPAYLYVYDYKVEIRDAADLWGMWKQKTEVTLRDRLNKQTGEIFSVLCIGPAGEHTVRYANAGTESIHSASKWGCDAVMGSKNLKAIAVRGTKGPLYADYGQVWELFKTYATSPITMARRLGDSRWGNTLTAPTMLRVATGGIKNNHLGYHEIVEQSDPHDHELKYCMWTICCPGCATACFNPYFKNTSRGTFAGEIRHDNTGGLNANIMVSYEEQVEIAALVDDLGMDSQELGGIIAWAMDLYEHGIITKDDLDSIDLRWGDVEATCKLLQNIAYKEDWVPAALAEGYWRAHPLFGKEAEYLTWEIQGCSCPTFDLRNQSPPYKSEIDSSLAFATSHNGAKIGAGPQAALSESDTICQFTQPIFGQIGGSTEEAVRAFLNPVCGWELTVDDVMDIKLRNYYFNRFLCLREGYYPLKYDRLPPRPFEEPITDKYVVTWVWNREEFEAEKRKFNVNINKLTKVGLPLRQATERLGLDFVIPILEPMGVIG
jgi:aldehyde:ferredoxin oxidoreductase